MLRRAPPARRQGDVLPGRIARARKYAALVRRIVAEGHTLLQPLVASPPGSRQADRGGDPRRPDQDEPGHPARRLPTPRIRYFRAAGRRVQPAACVTVAERMGMTVDLLVAGHEGLGRRRYGRGPAMVRHIVYALRHYTRPGSIVLAHDLRKPDTRRHRPVLPWLRPTSQWPPPASDASSRS